MLAAVNTRNGRLYNHGSYMNYGLSGIAVVELIRQGRLALENGKLIVKDASPTREDILDEVLQVIAAKTPPRKLNNWISLLPFKVKRIYKRVMERLEDNGILRIEEGKLLGLIPSRKYIVTNTFERDKIVNLCREALLKGDRSPGREMALVIAIAAVSGLLGRFFSREELKGLKGSIKQLKKGLYFEAGSDSMNEAAAAVQKAIAAAQLVAMSAGM